MGWSSTTTAPNMKSATCLSISIAVPVLSAVSVIEMMLSWKIANKTFVEEPQPSEHCPRKHGYFAHEELHVCDKFYYCVDGKFNMITCPNGLVYNENAGICSWPDEAKRKGCGSAGKTLSNSHYDVAASEISNLFLFVLIPSLTRYQNQFQSPDSWKMCEFRIYSKQVKN